MVKRPKTVEALVSRLKVHHLKEGEQSNMERLEAAKCIEGLIELVSVLAAENEQLKAEECPCKKREAELDMVFSEWNEENEK
jgi:hypothetical protein